MSIAKSTSRPRVHIEISKGLLFSYIIKICQEIYIEGFDEFVGEKSGSGSQTARQIGKGCKKMSINLFVKFGEVISGFIIVLKNWIGKS